MPDEDIIDWAFKESRIIPTADKDFGELAVSRGKNIVAWFVFLMPRLN
jgi:predicted nuclease of predicted toxin-antitoxin system